MIKRLSNVSTATFIRTGVLLLALINTSLQLFGVEVLPFTADEVETGLTVVLNAVAALVAWYKNNSVTEAGQIADKVLAAEKAKRKEGGK